MAAANRLSGMLFLNSMHPLAKLVLNWGTMAVMHLTTSFSKQRMAIGCLLQNKPSQDSWASGWMCLVGQVRVSPHHQLTGCQVSRRGDANSSMQATSITWGRSVLYRQGVVSVGWASKEPPSRFRTGNIPPLLIIHLLFWRSS